MLPDLPRDRAAVKRFRKLPDGALLRSDRLIVRDDLMTPLMRLGKGWYDAVAGRLLEPAAAHGAGRMTPSTGSGRARGVLILTPYFYPIIGGVESNAERLARYLVTQGVRVQVLTKRIGQNLPDEADRDGIAIRRIGPGGERSSLGKWLMTPAIVAMARPPRVRLRRRLLRRLPCDRRRRTPGAPADEPPGRVSGADHRRAVRRQRRSAAAEGGHRRERTDRASDQGADPGPLPGRRRVRLHLARHRARDAGLWRAARARVVSAERDRHDALPAGRAGRARSPAAGARSPG